MYTCTSTYIFYLFILVHTICICTRRSTCTHKHTDTESYVNWTVHHLDSWIKRDKLMSLALLFHYLLLNMFRMLIHPSSGACDLFVEIFHGLYCSCSMCVGVTLWFGWGGVVSGWVISWVVLFWFDVCWCYVVVWPNHNVTPTHIEPEQYNPWNNSTNKSQAPEDGCINIRNMLSSK